jgi:MtfA peptidase
LGILTGLGLVVVVAVAGWSVYGRWRRGRMRARLRGAGWPEGWEGWLREEVGLFGRLPGELRAQLAGEVQIFLHEKRFEACGGLEEVPERAKVVIGLLASLLVVKLRGEPLGRLRTLLIYPAAFVVRREGGGLFEEERREEVLIGESWETGSVVLSLGDVLSGARDGGDGTNVVLHEFAHQVAQEYGDAEGTPVPPWWGREELSRWATVWRQAYEQHVERVERRRRTLIDPYGAEEPAEFFAVVTEHFFEQPVALRERHGELYDELVRFYGHDPAGWRG